MLSLLCEGRIFHILSLFVCMPMGIVMVLLFLSFFWLLCGGNGDLLCFFTKIKKIKNQMDNIRKLLMKLHVVSVFAHKRLVKGIPLNHLEVVAFITT